MIGLPEGIPFKKPYNYGAHEMKKIMESASDIKFVIESSASYVPASSNPPVLPSTDLTSLREVLAKIAGTDSADKIMSNLQEKIPEEDVEVIDLKLTEEERIVLYSSAINISPTMHGWQLVIICSTLINLKTFCCHYTTMPQRVFGFFTQMRSLQE